jgi:uncharacterized protein YjbI with pentapeptide repeats
MTDLPSPPPDPDATPAVDAEGSTAPARPLRLPPPRQPRLSLAKLVAWGTVAGTAAGGMLFGWVAWVQSHQPAPWHDPHGWRAWMSHADGQAMVDAAHTSVAGLAVLGIGGAALVAYRRQDIAERTHEVAASQLQLDSQKYDLDRDRHQLETDRRTDDQERELRTRFTTIAEQLGSTNYAVRHAGAYALAALADDWHRFGRDNERQVCVDLLCAQLRSPRSPNEPLTAATAIRDMDNDLEVRRTMIALIRSHRPLTADGSDNWKSCLIDLSGANLSTFNLVETDLSAAILDGANLSQAKLRGADLSNAKMYRTTLSGADFSHAVLTGANLFGAHVPTEPTEDAWRNQVTFSGAQMRRATMQKVTLPNADFTKADLTEAKFYRAELIEAEFGNAILAWTTFVMAKLSKAGFDGADLSGTDFAGADLTEANFDNARPDDDTKWPDGIAPDGMR